MNRYLITFVLLLFLFACSQKNRISNRVEIVTKKGVLLSIGGREYYFLDRDIIEEREIEKCLKDTNNLFLTFPFYVKDCGIKMAKEKMRQFKGDYFKCGVWESENQIKYLQVTVEWKQKSERLTVQDKEYYNQKVPFCFFNPTESKEYEFLYKFTNTEVLKIKERIK
jgi:hypothetical protein